MPCVSFPPLTDVTSLIPTIGQLLGGCTSMSSIPKQAFPAGFDIRTLSPQLPPLPTVPATPIWPTIGAPSLECLLQSGGVLAFQFFGLIDELLGKLMAFASVVPIPEIPGLPGFDLVALLSFSIDDIIASLSGPGFNQAALLQFSPPLFPTLEIPDWKVLFAVQFATANYMNVLIGIIQSLIGTVTDILQIAGMPTLPTPPTMPQLLALVPSEPTLNDILNLSIPSFPSLLALPNPLVGDFDIPEFAVTYALLELQKLLSGNLLQIILDFVASLPISFVFPTIATLLGAIATIPDFCWE